MHKIIPNFLHPKHENLLHTKLVSYKQLFKKKNLLKNQLKYHTIDLIMFSKYWLFFVWHTISFLETSFKNRSRENNKQKRKYIWGKLFYILMVWTYVGFYTNPPFPQNKHTHTHTHYLINKYWTGKCFSFYRKKKVLLHLLNKHASYIFHTFSFLIVFHQFFFSKNTKILTNYFDCLFSCQYSSASNRLSFFLKNVENCLFLGNPYGKKTSKMTTLIFHCWRGKIDPKKDQIFIGTYLLKILYDYRNIFIRWYI